MGCFDLRLYKQLFDECKRQSNKKSDGKFRLDALIVKSNLDGSNYTNIGFAHGPLISFVKLNEAANDSRF